MVLSDACGTNQIEAPLLVTTLLSNESEEVQYMYHYAITSKDVTFHASKVLSSLPEQRNNRYIILADLLPAESIIDPGH